MRAAAWVGRIAAELGTERKTVSRSGCGLATPGMEAQPSGDSMLNPFAGFLTRRWNEGCRNAAQLWRELAALGFRGQPSTVRHWLSKRRLAAEQDGSPAATLPSAWPVPRGYRLARLLMAGTLGLNAEDELFRVQLLEDQPELGIAIAWAKQLNAVFRRQVAGNLDELLTAAASTMLARIAAGLRRDFDAINASLLLPWTTSPVEGQISRLKMLKRTMYSHAGFQLLRARVMNAA